jgi:isopenicillin N synthase-like dioxygenase
VGQHIPQEDERCEQHPHLIGPNIFPAEIPDSIMKEPTEAYYSELFKLSYKIMEILALGLPYGKDIFVPFMSNDPVCSIRLLHYPPQKSTDARQLGAGAHTDFGKWPTRP